MDHFYKPERHPPPGSCGAVCFGRWWLPARTIAVSSPPPGFPARTCSSTPDWQTTTSENNHKKPVFPLVVVTAGWSPWPSLSSGSPAPGNAPQTQTNSLNGPELSSRSFWTPEPISSTTENNKQKQDELQSRLKNLYVWMGKILHR